MTHDREGGVPGLQPPRAPSQPEEGSAGGRRRTALALGAASRRRAPRTALWTAVVVGAATVGLVAVLATRPPATTRAASSPLLGKPSPDVGGELLDGGELRLSSLRGRWVLVNFFATWCVPCRREHPDLVRFAARHEAGRDLAVVGVIYDDTPDAVRSFRREHGGSWPMLLDPKGSVALDFGVAGVPESYLLSPDGTVVSKVIGGVRDDELERLLQQARGSAL